nr:rhodanese-like domain-containing protein [Stappia sp. MMSF_3263]
MKRKLADGAVLVDIRRPEEWKETGVIEGARLLTFFDGSGKVNPGFLADFTALADRNDPVVLICRTGSRSSVVARYLAERAGYSKIDSVEKGVMNWIAEGNQVTTASLPENCWLC